MEARWVKTVVRSDWERTLVVCGKCSKKLGGGFGPEGRLPLGKALRRYLGLAKGRKTRIGIVEAKCLGICPRNSVVAIDAAEPGTWLLIPRGAALDTVAATLRLPLR